MKDERETIMMATHETDCEILLDIMAAQVAMIAQFVVEIERQCMNQGKGITEQDVTYTTLMDIIDYQASMTSQFLSEIAKNRWLHTR